MVIVIVLFGICIVTAVGLGILLWLADRRERKSTR